MTPSGTASPLRVVARRANPGVVHVRTLFDAPPPARRSPWSTSISFLLHSAAFGGIAALAYFNVTVIGVRPHEELQFFAVAMSPPVDVPAPVAAPPPPLIKPPEPPPEPKAEEPPPPVIVKTPEPEPPPAPEPPKPAEIKKPDVKVGAFDQPATAAAASQPRQVASTVFDTQQAVAPNVNLQLGPTGAFDQSKNARPGSDVAKGTVASTGFDQRAAAAQTAARTVAATGFGTTQAAAPTQPKPQVVQQTAFAAAAPAADGKPAAKPIGPTTPVEITFKPTPEYTDEARTQRIEGEVVIQVDFTATGEVRIVRVVKGLGHGLDEKAIDAAARIRFKPALDQGRPVDSRADVRIFFKVT